MLKRKIEDRLLAWKNTENRNPLVIKGCRQCGKTYSVLSFAKKHYAHVVYLNFFENPEYSSAFSGALDVGTIVIMLSALMGNSASFVPNSTVIILDEIQECPQARTALKFFKIDGRYDIIATGSLLGVRGFGHAPASIPVGYETVIDMTPLDFEEFLWACGIDDAAISVLRQCLRSESPVPEALHSRFRTLLLRYAVTGGMPAVVQAFADTRNMSTVLQMQRDIVRSYEDDMLKYAPPKDRPLIAECFRSIPRQLAKENRKFQYSAVRKGGTAARFEGALQWIEDAGIISRCRCLSITELPLDGNAEQDVFKVYTRDTGLFVSMLEDGTQFDILNGNLYAYKGAVFENLAGDIFSKMGRGLYYFRRDSGLEIDFVIRWRGKCVPVEIKASTGNTKSLKTLLKHPEKYHVDEAIKLGDYNVGRDGSILTLPMYMAFLLTATAPDRPFPSLPAAGAAAAERK
ncbi:MAG: ATP-binding protein [Mailhella sp.]|nr:ATP-binding protein [Mailhella sp.]